MTTSAVSRLAIGARTDVGAVRKRNEDSILTESPDADCARAYGWLGIVADGLGGHRSGDYASKLAVQTTRDAFYLRPETQSHTPGQRLRAAVELANQVILTTGGQAPEYAHMASTITAAAIVGSKLFIAQVGDSRAYLIRNSRIRQVTRDHSLVEELVRNGELTHEEALRHPNRNVITRALGTQPGVEVDVFEEYLRNGDAVLLCSDGLYRVVEDAELATALSGEPQAIAESLVALANQRGGPDNISVILVRISINDDSEITLVGPS